MEFSERERAMIRAKLIDRGRELFSRFGLKKTSIEILAKSAGIAKGSFYSFFDSKEILYLEIIEEEEITLNEPLLALLERRIDIDDLIDELWRLFLSAQGNPLINQVYEEGVMETLVRRITPERLQEHLDVDEERIRLIGRIAEANGYELTERPEMLAGLFRAIFVIALNREIVGLDVFEVVQKKMIELVLYNSLKRKES